MRGHPHRADELYDYKHVIREAANDFFWDNIYDYDVEFCHHMVSHPDRGWSTKLTDKWTQFMKDHLHPRNPRTEGEGYKSGSGSNLQRTEICKRYNKGWCSWGKNCRNIHKCSVCGKHGHGASIYYMNKNKEKEAASSTKARPARVGRVMPQVKN